MSVLGGRGFFGRVIYASCRHVSRRKNAVNWRHRRGVRGIAGVTETRNEERLTPRAYTPKCLSSADFEKLSDRCMSPLRDVVNSSSYSGCNKVTGFTDY